LVFGPDEVREKVLERDNNTCQKCGKTNLQEKDQEIDHKIPVSMGGDNFDLKNLQTLCHECHVHKTIEDLTNLRYNQNVPLLINDFYEIIEMQERNTERWVDAQSNQSAKKLTRLRVE